MIKQDEKHGRKTLGGHPDVGVITKKIYLFCLVNKQNNNLESVI